MACACSDLRSHLALPAPPLRGRLLLTHSGTLHDVHAGINDECTGRKCEGEEDLGCNDGIFAEYTAYGLRPIARSVIDDDGVCACPKWITHSNAPPELYARPHL